MEHKKRAEKRHRGVGKRESCIHCCCFNEFVVFYLYVQYQQGNNFFHIGVVKCCQLCSYILFPEYFFFLCLSSIIIGEHLLWTVWRATDSSKVCQKTDCFSIRDLLCCSVQSRIQSLHSIPRNCSCITFIYYARNTRNKFGVCSHVFMWNSAVVIARCRLKMATHGPICGEFFRR